MADMEYADDDPSFFFDDDDYLYVEDDYGAADELAETQVPSPGYSGVKYELDMESYDYDLYEYFGELEYGADSYWDAPIKHLEKDKDDSESEANKAGQKRKAGEGERLPKRRKVVDGDAGEGENVVYIPFEERAVPLPAEKPDGRVFALLPDWKEKFADKGDGEDRERAMPADMKRAAEGEGEGGDDGDEAMEVEDEEEGEGEAEGGGIDHDVLMQVLRQKLADSGLGDVDEKVFEDAISKMLKGDGDGDNAAGGLASLLLGQGGGGGGWAFEGFLAGQGVQIGDEAEENEEDVHQGETESTPASTQTESGKPSSQKPPAGRTSSPRGNPHGSPSTSKSPRRTRAPTSTTEAASIPPSAPPESTPSGPRSSRKRRAPSLNESSPPQPQAQTETTAKPSAKRRRAPRDAPAQEPPGGDSAAAAAPVTEGRTTRSAAASGKRRR